MERIFKIRHNDNASLAPAWLTAGNLAARLENGLSPSAIRAAGIRVVDVTTAEAANEGSYIRNGIFHPREDETEGAVPFTQLADGRLIVKLDGYAIIPLPEFYDLQQKAGQPELIKLPPSKQERTLKQLKTTGVELTVALSDVQACIEAVERHRPLAKAMETVQRLRKDDSGENR